MDSARRRFNELLGLALDEACSDAELEEFTKLSQEHPELLTDCVETIFTHCLLAWQCDDISECLALERSASDQEAALAAAVPGRSRKMLPHWPWACAAMLLVAIGIAGWLSFHRARTTELALAEIVEHGRVVWAADTTARRPGNLLIPGRLTANSGNFTLQFRSGPTVMVVGPAWLTIESGMLVYLDRGQATARVPETSRGFAIKTPVAKVVDQGTVFGVAARDDGKTDVIVFEGRVDVQETAGSMPQPRSLFNGEAARIDDQGAIDRIMQIGRDTSGRWWTDDRPMPHESVIRLVRDNIPTNNSSRYFCYQIAYQGLADDVFAYPDHPHQWNGLTGDGLPDFLRGADYVQTFNDYRYLNDFEMIVELSQPANLYIFFDDRVPAPEWLIAQFEDTHVDVGLDEGPWVGIPDEYLATVPDRSHGVGGGKSIDNVFSVWRRLCRDTRPITLGPVGVRPNRFGRAMYGIAATPLDEPQPATEAAATTSGI